MDRSLSIVLPVFNVQASLAGRVGRLLEVLPELTGRFEIMIVDDASTDDTDEIAHDLSRQYIQVKHVRHNRRRGQAAALKSGLESTSGEIVFVQQQDAPFSETDLHRLWQLRNDPELVMAQAEPQTQTWSSGLVQRLMAWGAAMRRSASQDSPGMQMIRRQAVQQLDSPNTKLRIDHVEQTGKVLRDEAPREVRRPSFFSRIKDFAVGQ